MGIHLIQEQLLEIHWMNSQPFMGNVYPKFDGLDLWSSKTRISTTIIYQNVDRFQPIVALFLQPSEKCGSKTRPSNSSLHPNPPKTRSHAGSRRAARCHGRGCTTWFWKNEGDNPKIGGVYHGLSSSRRFWRVYPSSNTHSDEGDFTNSGGLEAGGCHGTGPGTFFSHWPRASCSLTVAFKIPQNKTQTSLKMSKHQYPMNMMHPSNPRCLPHKL